MGCLVYTDENHIDIGVLQSASLDLDYGGDEETDNTFQVTIDRSDNIRLEPFSYVYIEGTEYGGMVVGLDSDTDPSINALFYNGLTWHGLLNAKIIEPDAGQDHLVVSGEANSVISSLFARLGLSEVFRASEKNSGISISNYQFDRYIEGYTGIKKMLASYGAKLKLEYDGAHVVAWAEPVVDYSEYDTMDPYKMALRMRKNYLPVNHLVCLGTGELDERIVVHLYADAKGNVSQTQSLFGLMERALKYDYTSADRETLIEDGTEKLLELQACDASEMNLFDDSEYDIGDIVGSYDPDTGILLITSIASKIVSIDSQDNIVIEYQNTGRSDT